MTYRKAGVDIEKGDRAVKRIREMVHSTYNQRVVSKLGLFSGMYHFPANRFKQPVLVSSVDGVGTKLKIAILMNKYDTIGEDLVNHCVNDIAVGGAQPLFFLDYFATGKLKPKVFENVIKGFVRGCQNNDCALIGGETAEMPDLYRPGDFDVSGTIVGFVEKQHLINGQSIKKGDILVGVNSSGLHTNGYSLARRVLLKKWNVHHHISELGRSLGSELLQTHLSYLSLIQAALKKVRINGISHITGGGIVGNTKRLLRDGLTLQIDWQAWSRPPIFQIIQKAGQVPEADMRKTFNLGIGLIFIVRVSETDLLTRIIRNYRFKPCILGEIR